jgi:hypothetical protein
VTAVDAARDVERDWDLEGVLERQDNVVCVFSRGWVAAVELLACCFLSTTFQAAGFDIAFFLSLFWIAMIAWLVFRGIYVRLAFLPGVGGGSSCGMLVRRRSYGILRA